MGVRPDPVKPQGDISAAETYRKQRYTPPKEVICACSPATRQLYTKDCFFFSALASSFFIVVGFAVLWDFIDRLGQGRPLDGYILSFTRWFNKWTANFNSRFVKKKEDSYMLNVVILQGILLPLMFLAAARYAIQNDGISYPLILIYHILRIGPYFMNFAYCYTLCHKEGHSRRDLTYFSQYMYNSLPCFRYVFNWWIGLFYGVMCVLVFFQFRIYF
eukprot:GSMAST32.ASY1.ANO1.1422.1 assembled CDS